MSILARAAYPARVAVRTRADEVAMKPALLLSACLALAPAATWAAPRTLLPDESAIEFSVKEMGVAVSGRFKRFDAAIDIDAARPEKSSATVRVDVGSLTTGNDEADAIAVDADWLDKAHARTAMFRSTNIRVLAAGRYEAKGLLSIRNTERDIAFQFSSVDQPDGKTIINGEFALARSRFGIGGGVWNQGDVIADAIPVKVRLVLAPVARR